MSVVRVLSVAAAGGVLLVTPHLVTASASPVPTGSAPAIAARHDRPVIEGVVVDQCAAHPDDVEVAATTTDGTPVASALTYESGRSGGPQHGYFFLEVGKKGSYNLDIRKSGYKPAELGPVTVGRRQSLDLGEIAIESKGSCATATTATLQKNPVGKKDNAKVDVTVTTGADVDEFKGEVAVLEQVRKKWELVGTATLGKNGEVTVKVDRLKKGQHTLKATYDGSKKLKLEGSSSDLFTLRVT